MTAPVYPSCPHNTYHSHLRGVLLRQPCWEPGCPGGRATQPGSGRTARSGEWLMSSLICTSCTRGTHLSCRRPQCQCPCRQSMPPVLHEVAETLDQPRREDGGGMTAHYAAMCACGKVWLLDGIDRFFAEGAEHTRDWCRRTDSTAPHMVDIATANPGVVAPVSVPDPIPPGG